MRRPVRGYSGFPRHRLANVAAALSLLAVTVVSCGADGLPSSSAPGEGAPSTEASVTDPDAGGIYYAPGGSVLAVFYDDLGQTVPAPGLVRLGAVDGDPASIAAAGNRVWVRLDLADGTGS